MPTINPPVPNDGENADASDVSIPIAAILSLINGHLDGDNIEPGSLPWSVMGSISNSIPAAALQDEANAKKYRDDLGIGVVVSGLEWSALSGLNATMSAGVMYPADGSRVAPSSVASRAFTANKDTYVSISPGGSLDYQEVANGATSMSALGTDYIALAKVVTNGSAITSISMIGGDLNGNVFRPQPGQIFYVTRSDNGTWTTKKCIRLSGMGKITGSGTANQSAALTWPIKFKSAPIGIANAIGYRNSVAAFDSTTVLDDWGGQKAELQKALVTGGTLRMYRLDGGTYSATSDYYYSYEVIGEVN